MDILFGAVKNIILFLIIMTIVMNLIGNSSFKQYVRLFGGMILILIVIMPVMDFFDITDKLNYYVDLNRFRVNANDISDQLVHAEEGSKARIVKEYKSNLSEQVKSKLSIHNLYAKGIDIAIEEDETSSQFGKLTSITILACTKSPDDREETTSEIDKIVIDKIKINSANQITSKEKKDTGYESLLELTVRKEIAAFFGLDVEQVAVDVEE